MFHLDTDVLMRCEEKRSFFFFYFWKIKLDVWVCWFIDGVSVEDWWLKFNFDESKGSLSNLRS